MHSAFVASRLRFVCQPELVELAVTHHDALMTLDPYYSLCAVSHIIFLTIRPTFASRLSPFKVHGNFNEY